VGDELQISATNPNTALDVAVRNIGGIVDVGGSAVTQTVAASVAATAGSLQDVVDGLDGFNETIRITASAATAFANNALAADALISLEGGDFVTIPQANIANAAAGGTVQDLVDEINLNLGDLTSNNGRTITLEATVTGTRLTIRAFETGAGVTSQVALDPATLDSNDFLIGNVAPDVAADSGIDITGAFDASGFLSISAFQSGQQIDINVSAIDIDDAVVDETNTTDGTTGTGVITGSTGDFAETFAAELTQTQQVFDALGTAHSVELEYRKRDDESNLWEVAISDDGVTDFTGSYDPTSNDGCLLYTSDAADE